MGRRRLTIFGSAASFVAILGTIATLWLGSSQNTTEASTFAMTIVQIPTTIVRPGVSFHITIPPQALPTGSGSVAIPIGVAPQPVVGSLTPHAHFVADAPACKGADLQGSVTSNGPFMGMGTVQDVTTVTSSTTCTLNGYPSLHMQGAGGELVLTVTDGGAMGNAPGAGPITIGGSNVASFLIQYGYRTNGVSACPAETHLSFTIPNDTTSVPVPFASNMWAMQSAFNPCSGAINVTPFEPNNSPLEY